MKLNEIILAEGDKHLSSPAKAYNYARNVLNGRFPEGEPIIATSAQISHWYANEVLHGPFPAAEPTIAKSAEYSYFYAKEILHGPFPAGEPSIATNPLYSYLYAINIPGINPEFIKSLLTNDTFINDGNDYYTKLVKQYFKDNTILMNKWLRYADNMRGLG